MGLLTEEDGSIEFDSNGYDEAMLEWHRYFPLY